MRIREFKAVRPRTDMVDQVASVPYDTVNTQEARLLAEGNPWSFLKVVRPEIDLPDDVDVYSDEVYAKAKENFDVFQARGVLEREEEPCLYLYRQKMGEHVQRGIVACCHIDDYQNNIILKHEKTRADKEDDRTRHVNALEANTGPVFLTYRDDPDIDVLIASVEAGAPMYDLVASDGVAHTIWRVSNKDEIVDAFKAVQSAYVADGHHRSAAAVRAGVERKEKNPDHTGDEEYNWYLTVLFPAGQLAILPYNRCVHDLNGLSEDDFLKAVGEQFSVTEGTDPMPSGSQNVSMYLAGKWYGLSWNVPEKADPVASLDVSFLQDNLLKPLLGIDDPRTAKRIDFIGGIRGTDELAKLVDSGRGAVAFSMYPVTVEQMMAIADAGMIMPPKSTWFEPKLRSGLLVHTL